MASVLLHMSFYVVGLSFQPTGRHIRFMPNENFIKWVKTTAIFLASSSLYAFYMSLYLFNITLSLYIVINLGKMKNSSCNIFCTRMQCQSSLSFINIKQKSFKDFVFFNIFLMCPIWLPVFSYFSYIEPELGVGIILAWL